MSMMGKLNYFLGLLVKQMDHGTFLHQTKYYKELLKKFEMEKSKEFVTLMATNCYLGADEKGKSIDQTKYRGIIGSLLYLTASRPNIIFSVYMCAHYQSSPKESYFSIIKRIMKYLKGNLDVG